MFISSQDFIVKDNFAMHGFRKTCAEFPIAWDKHLKLIFFYSIERGDNWARFDIRQ